MQYGLMVSVVVWVALAMVVIGLALYRKLISRGEMDIVHVRDSEAELIPGQESFAKRLDLIDHWGKILTVVTVVYGLAIAVVYLVKVWQERNSLGG